MAELIGHRLAVIGATDVVHTSAQNTVGTRAFDSAGNEYIYMQGVASVVVGDWVAYDELFITTRLVSATIGAVAIAQAAVDATTEFGWWGIYGLFSGGVVTGADNAKVWTTATAGRVDNTDVAAQIVTNAIQRGATASNLANFQIAYPFAHNEVLN